MAEAGLVVERLNVLTVESFHWNSQNCFSSSFSIFSFCLFFYIVKQLLLLIPLLFRSFFAEVSAPEIAQTPSVVVVVAAEAEE